MRADSLPACPGLGVWEPPQGCPEGGHGTTPHVETNPTNPLRTAPSSSSTLHVPAQRAQGEPAPEQEQFGRKPRSLHSIYLWRIRAESTSHYQELSLGTTAQGWQPAPGWCAPPLLGTFLPVCKAGWTLHLHSFGDVNYDPQAHVTKERFPSPQSHQARIAA